MNFSKLFLLFLSIASLQNCRAINSEKEQEQLEWQEDKKYDQRAQKALEKAGFLLNYKFWIFKSYFTKKSLQKELVWQYIKDFGQLTDPTTFMVMYSFMPLYVKENRKPYQEYQNLINPKDMDEVVGEVIETKNRLAKEAMQKGVVLTPQQIDNFIVLYHGALSILYYYSAAGARYSGSENDECKAAAIFGELYLDIIEFVLEQIQK